MEKYMQKKRIKTEKKKENEMEMSKNRDEIK